MSYEHLAKFVFYVTVAIVVVLIWRAVIRRRSRNALVDEIMSKSYDEKTMAQAIVEAGGNNEKARQIYVRKRLRQMTTQRTREADGGANGTIRNASIGMLAAFAIMIIVVALHHWLS